MCQVPGSRRSWVTSRVYPWHKLHQTCVIFVIISMSLSILRYKKTIWIWWLLMVTVDISNHAGRMWLSPDAPKTKMAVSFNESLVQHLQYMYTSIWRTVCDSWAQRWKLSADGWVRMLKAECAMFSNSTSSSYGQIICYTRSHALAITCTTVPNLIPQVWKLSVVLNDWSCPQTKKWKQTRDLNKGLEGEEQKPVQSTKIFLIGATLPN